MFKIIEENFGNFTQVKLLNSNTQEYFSFIPQFGACLNNLVFLKKNRFYSVLNSSNSYKDLVTEGKKYFKGSKLFPFPNRIKNGKYEFEDKLYSLPINFEKEGHAIHGLVLESKFQIIDKRIAKNKASVIAQFSYNASLKYYPFKYKLSIIFSFGEKEGFKCTTIAQNLGKKNMPMGDGWHPYFKTGTKIDYLFLELPSDKIIEVDKNMIPTTRIIHRDDFSKLSKIKKKSLDTCYRITKSKKGIAHITLFDPKEKVKLIIWQQAKKQRYKYLQVFTPPSRKCIALESMTCAPDVFNNMLGLIILKPKETFQSSFGIKLI